MLFVFFFFCSLYLFFVVVEFYIRVALSVVFRRVCVLLPSFFSMVFGLYLLSVCLYGTVCLYSGSGLFCVFMVLSMFMRFYVC